MTRQMTKEGYAFLENEEGERLFVYDDATGRKLRPGDPIRGTATAGIGHTGKDVVPGMTVTKELSERWFDQDTDWAEACVEASCQGPATAPVIPNDHQFDAMVSLCFNIGAGAFRGSSVVRMWNKGDQKAAGNAISMWCKSTIDGVLQDHPVLIARRARETAMFFTPSPGAIAKPMPQTVEDPGKVVTAGKVITAASATIPPAVIVASNAKPAIDAIQNTAETVKQATGAWASVKDALSVFQNGHVLTVVGLLIALGVLAFVVWKVWHLIRRGEVSGS